MVNNGWDLFWYNYSLIALTGYIVVDKGTLILRKKSKKLRENNENLRKNFVKIFNYDISNDEIEKIYNMICSNEFKMKFSYTKIGDINTYSNSELLKKANNKILNLEGIIQGQENYISSLKKQIKDEKIDDNDSILLQKANNKIANLKYLIENQDKRIFHLVNQLKKEKATFNNDDNRFELLKKANNTIRSANIRISDLKSTIRNLEVDISSLRTELKDERSKSGNGKEFDKFSPYEILGLKYGERDKKVIKVNYKKLSNIYHFDKSGSNEIMKKINYAYDKLK